MKSFTLYLMGAEIPGWKKLLEEAGSPMGVSFKGLQRRLPKTVPYRLEERFEGDYPLFLDSGGHSFNKARKVPDRQELLDYAERYERFVEQNVDRLTLVSEFDALALGREWVLDRREAFYDHLDPSKFMPIWHESYGLQALQEDATRYEVLGTGTTESATGSNLQPHLTTLGRAGVRLHGVAMTKPDLLRVIPFASASSTSWLSPMQYGDTIVWDGSALHRYPRDYKDRARRQHRMLFEREGFDADAILADDATEVARFTIWSWQQQAAALGRMRGPRPVFSDGPEDQIADTGGDNQEGSDAQQGSGASVIDLPEGRKSTQIRDARKAVERTTRISLPILGQEALTSTETDAEGNEIVHTRHLTRAGSKSGRVCNNCYLADRCPIYQPDSECGYDIPVEARTAEQRSAIMEGLIELQTQRVAFMKFAEDRNGGYADPNLSSEMDRLFKLMATKKDIEDDRDSFEMTIKSKGAMSTLERVFGREAPPRHGQEVAAVDPVKIIDAKVT